MAYMLDALDMPAIRRNWRGRKNLSSCWTEDANDPRVKRYEKESYLPE